VLGILALIPLALLVDQILFQVDYPYREDSIKQIIFMILGIPILILNLWAWMYPEIIEFYFFRKES
jgi:hypothetical protein